MVSFEARDSIQENMRPIQVCMYICMQQYLSSHHVSDTNDISRIAFMKIHGMFHLSRLTHSNIILAGLYYVFSYLNDYSVRISQSLLRRSDRFACHQELREHINPVYIYIYIYIYIQTSWCWPFLRLIYGTETCGGAVEPSAWQRFQESFLDAVHSHAQKQSHGLMACHAQSHPLLSFLVPPPIYFPWIYI